MSIDLERQLADYGRQLEAEQQPVGRDEITPRDDAVRPIPLVATDDSRQWRRNARIGAAAAAVVVLLIGGIALLVSQGQIEPADQPVTSLSPTTVPPTTTAPPTTEAPSTALESIEWTTIEAGLPGSPFHLISDGNSFYTLAETADGSELWASDDGTAWRLVGEVPFSTIAAAWEGKVIGLESDYSFLNTTFMVYVVDPDGTITESAITAPIPDHHAPFARNFSMSASFLDEDGVVATVEYDLPMSYVLAVGLGYPAEDLPTQQVEDEFDEEQLLAAALGISVDEYIQRYDAGMLDENMVGAQGVGDTPDLVVELSGLGLSGVDLFEVHPVTFVSSDGIQWSQIGPPAARVRSTVTIDGGLVGAVHDVSPDLRPDEFMAVSQDGIEWETLELNLTGELFPWNGGALLLAQREGDRSFWVITMDGATQLNTAGIDAADLQSVDSWTLTAGTSGIAFLAGFPKNQNEMQIPSEIVSSADGATWTRSSLPDDFVGPWFRIVAGAEGVMLVNGNGEAWLGTFDAASLS